MSVRLLVALLLMAGLLPGSPGAAGFVANCAQPAPAVRSCGCCNGPQSHCCIAEPAQEIPLTAPVSQNDASHTLLTAVLPGPLAFLYVLPSARPTHGAAAWTQADFTPHVPAPLALNCVRLI